ncbi:MAG: alanine--tRNA ligase-related protein [Acidimicrobiales bacterium]
METEPLYRHDAYLRTFDGRVVARDGPCVALDRTAFYATGGGQPHDTGRLDAAVVTDVRKEGGLVWHSLDGLVGNTGEVGRVRVVKTESKGKAFKRIRIEVTDG